MGSTIQGSTVTAGGNIGSPDRIKQEGTPASTAYRGQSAGGMMQEGRGYSSLQGSSVQGTPSRGDEFKRTGGQYGTARQDTTPVRGI